jgi:S1-C subfamily serine protease
MKYEYIALFVFFVLLSAIGFDVYKSQTERISHPVVLLTVPETNATSSAVHVGNGYFFTTNHSLLNKLKVELLPQGFDEPILANVLWISSTYDIAYVYAPELSNMNHYPLSCVELEIGQELEFHGNPAGLTAISTWGRVAGSPFNPPTDFWELIVPVHATIIPGMSGGSVTLNGELVGINVGTHVYSMGFAGSFTNISYIVPNSVLCQLISG